jgi:hypothetical protein
MALCGGCSDAVEVVVVEKVGLRQRTAVAVFVFAESHDVSL